MAENSWQDGTDSSRRDSESEGTGDDYEGLGLQALPLELQRLFIQGLINAGLYTQRLPWQGSQTPETAEGGQNQGISNQDSQIPETPLQEVSNLINAELIEEASSTVEKPNQRVPEEDNSNHGKPFGVCKPQRQETSWRQSRPAENSGLQGGPTGGSEAQGQETSWRQARPVENSGLSRSESSRRRGRGGPPNPGDIAESRDGQRRGTADAENNGGTIRVVGPGDEILVGVKGADGRVHALQLAVFRMPVGEINSVAKIVRRGAEFLYLHDEDGFVGYGHFTGASHLNQFATSDFARAKAAVLKEFQIERVLEDWLVVSRDDLLTAWRRQLVQVVTQGAVHDITEMTRIQRKFAAGNGGSMEILGHIYNTSSLPDELKEATKLLHDEQRKVEVRNEKFGCFSQRLLEVHRLSSVSGLVDDMCSLGMGNYYLKLQEILKNSGSLGDKMTASLAQLRNNPTLLHISRSDIEYFKRLEEIAKRFAVSDQLAKMLHGMWETFLANATKPRQAKKLMTPVYPYLMTSFLETVTELSEKTGRKVCDSADTRWADMDGLLKLTADWWDLNSIRWKAGTEVKDRALEKESRFLLHIMEHAKPGTVLVANNINKCRACNPSSDSFWTRPFKALMRLREAVTGGGTEPIESLVWTTVLRSGMSFLLEESRRKEDEFFHNEYEELLKTLEDVYANYVATCDSSESCRVAARYISGFAAQMFGQMARLTRPCDAEVLRSQTQFVSRMMDFTKNGTQFAKYLSPLIVEFVRYWENRKDFDLAVGATLTYEPFAREIRDTCDDLHATLHAVLVKTELSADAVLDYLRLFNEFLTTFQHINFVWLVQADPGWRDDMGRLARKAVAGKNTVHYEVTDQKAFVEALKTENLDVPKHFVLAIARRLTSLVFASLVHEESDEQTRVQGTGNLLEAIRKAFIHLDDQINYHSFEQFENDLCKPFESVAEKMNHYADFKRHLDNLENFFVYTRRQNEINIDKALEMFESRMSNNGDGAQGPAFDAGVLKESFTVYDEAFKVNISKHYNEGVNILQTIKSSFPVKDHSQWDTAFRRQRIPELLAAVSAFWSIRESVHVIDTGNSIKPHCIQILCVLRLLNVDQDCRSLRKHLAEVLTGQGKSLVLGLLASVLALTGHSVQIVCYSKYLANRDQQAFEEFFGALGIMDKVKYGTFDDLANEVLRVEANGSVRYARDLFRDLILDQLPAAAKANWRAAGNRKVSSILLVDEVDVFFTPEYYGNLYRLAVTPGMPALAMIQEKIWETLSQPRGFFGAFGNGNIGAVMQDFVKQIVRENRDRQFSRFFASSERLFQKYLNEMIEDGRQVYGGDQSNNRFKINENGFITFRDNDGLYKQKTRLRYNNAFNYMRLKEDNFEHKNFANYGYLSISCGQVSFAELPKEYPVILGVSGTISTLSTEEMTVVKESYGIKDLSCMPTFFGKVNLAFDPNKDFLIADNESQWQEAILRTVREKQQMKRAVIVFFDSESDIDKFTDRFKNDLTAINKLTGNEEATQLERCIKDAGVAGSLTLAIRAMGRGVDYRTSFTVEQNGGVHVVQTFLSLDVKEETQIKGRTARKDNKGSYELILCRQQLVNDGVLKARDGNVSYAALHALRTAKAAEKYKENGERVRQSLERHKLSLDVIKSFANYHPNKRTSYFSKYPFA